MCMFTVSNALLMSNATAMVRVGGMSWLKPASKCSFHMFCLCFICRKLSPHLGV